MNLLGVLCLLGGLVVPCFALDREAFTFTKYDLDLRVEPEQQRLGVRGRITLRNDASVSQKNMALQVSSTLHWRSIQVAGKAVDFVAQEYTSDIDHTGALSEAIVTLPHEVPPKGTIELEVGYEGIVALDASRLSRIGVPKEKARHTDWDQIGKSFTAVRGVGYVVWYPVAMESASLSEGNSVFEALGHWKGREAEADLKIRLDDSGARSGELPLLLCNGKGGIQGDQQISRAYAVTAECRYLPLDMTVPLFVIGSYTGPDRSVVNISYLPGHKSGAENYALAADLAVPLVTEWFGAPRQKAETVELADPEAAPFESGVVLLTPLGGTDSMSYELTAVHQLTHAAFFSPRPWIYEGLGHFAQALEQEEQHGRQAALDFMVRHRIAVVEAEKALAALPAQNAAADESLINTGTEEFYRSKAMYVWWMLRDMIGDAALKKALAAYRADQDKESAYFERLVETQTQRDLEWFFDDWVYRDRGLPDLRIDSAYARATVNGGYVITVTTVNLGDAGAEVPVTVRMRDGEVTKRVEVHAKSQATVRIEAATTPQAVVVNDGSVPESDVSNNIFTVPSPNPAK